MCLIEWNNCKSAAKWNCRLWKLCLQLGEKREKRFVSLLSFSRKANFPYATAIGIHPVLALNEMQASEHSWWYPVAVWHPCCSTNSKDNGNAPPRSSLQGKCIFRSTSFLLRIIPFVLQVQFINDFHFVYSFITFRYEPNFAILKWCSLSHKLQFDSTKSIHFSPRKNFENNNENSEKR